VHQFNPALEDVVGKPPPQLIRDSLRRRAERMTVRVRNIACDGIATGSGFALSSHELLTNRHVVAGAAVLQVSTWDGHSFEVTTAQVGALVDLGVVHTDRALPQVARYGPPANKGDKVTAVGYPLGGELTLSPGQVIDYVDGVKLGVPGRVMRITSDVRPGNSGGPLLNERDEVVGIVYAIEISTGYGLAIPVKTFQALLDAGGLTAVPDCGQE